MRKGISLNEAEPAFEPLSVVSGVRFVRNDTNVGANDPERP